MMQINRSCSIFTLEQTTCTGKKLTKIVQIRYNRDWVVFLDNKVFTWGPSPRESLENIL